MPKALLIIDLQNDYFPGGKFPLWQPEEVLTRVETLAAKATAAGVKIILVQHLADASRGPAPFFNPDTEGAELHPRARAVAPVIIKHFADAFHKTNLEETLAADNIDELFICGMMTQNCVTHTAISKAAEKFQITVVADCCTTVTEILHKIALSALATRVAVRPSTELFDE